MKRGRSGSQFVYARSLGRGAPRQVGWRPHPAAAAGGGGGGGPPPSGPSPGRARPLGACGGVVSRVFVFMSAEDLFGRELAKTPARNSIVAVSNSV